MKLLEQVSAALDGLLPSGARIDVAVSGGPDSATLLDIMARLAPSQSWQLRAHHIRHGLRNDAADAEAARQLADRLGVLFVETRVHVDAASGAGPEEKARRARYQALETAASRAGVRWLATGHTADDNHETLLLRWVRGAGLDGMSGIPFVRGLSEELRVIRPLLGAARDEVHTWVREQSLPSHRDPTNENPRYLRNRVRQVLPAIQNLREGAPGAMSRTMANLARDAVAMDALVGEVIASGHMTREGSWYLSLATARRLGPEGLTAVLRRAALRVADHLPSAQAVLAGVEAALAPPSEGRRPWRDGVVRLGRDGDWVTVSAESATGPESWSRRSLPGSGCLPGDLEYQVVPASDLLKEGVTGVLALSIPALPDLALTPAGECSRMAVAGMNGRKPLSEIMRERGVPRRWRPVHPVLVSGDEPLAVVGGSISQTLVRAEKTPDVLVVRPMPWYFDRLVQSPDR